MGRAIWIYLIFGGIWFLVTLMAARLWSLPTEAAIAIGFSVALFWLLNRKVEKIQETLQGHIQELYEYINNPTILRDMQQQRLVTQSIVSAITNGRIVKGMTAEQMRQALEEAAVKAVTFTPGLRDLGKMTYNISFFESYPLGIHEPKLRLHFVDGKLSEWQVTVHTKDRRAPDTYQIASRYGKLGKIKIARPLRLGDPIDEES